MINTFLATKRMRIFSRSYSNFSKNSRSLHIWSILKPLLWSFISQVFHNPGPKNFKLSRKIKFLSNLTKIYRQRHRLWKKSQEIYIYIIRLLDSLKLSILISHSINFSLYSFAFQLYFSTWTLKVGGTLMKSKVIKNS